MQDVETTSISSTRTDRVPHSCKSARQAYGDVACDADIRRVLFRPTADLGRVRFKDAWFALLMQAAFSRDVYRRTYP